MEGTAKIRVRNIGSGRVYDLSIVHNFRDPISGKATNRVLAYFGAIRHSERLMRAPEFYRWLDAELDRLEGEIYANCAGEIRRKFQTIIPVPPVTAASPMRDIRAILAARGHGLI